jgi:hypothetical protein
MKKYFEAKLTCLILFCVVGVISTYAQPCENSGIGTNTPTSKLHIKGCGTTTGSSLHVMNSAGNPLFFVQDDGRVGLGTTTPAAMLHLNWGGYGAIYFGNNDAFGHIITHELDNSFNIWSGTYGVNSIVRMRIDVSGKVGIGTSLPLAKLDVMEATPLGTASNNSQLLAMVRGVTGTTTYNEVKNNLWLRRRTAGADWMTASLHDGISVDLSYSTPGTDTKTWWERDPWNNVQSWGSQATTFMTLDGLGRFGIGMQTPIYKLHLNGANVNGEMATFQNGTQETFFLTKALYQSYNQIVAANDNGIFWRDNMVTPNPTSGFVIAPWNDATPSTVGGLRGIRIDGPTGNLGVGTATPFYKIEATGDIFANQGTLMASKNTPEGGGLMLFNLTKTGASQNIYKFWNMTGGYGNKFSIWGYSANGSLLPAERFSIWDNGDFSFHGTTSVSMVKFAANGNVGIGTALITPLALLHLKDGHIRSEQTTAPTVTTTTQNGITAAAIVAGSTDTKGTITTTGDNNGTNTVLTIKFNKMYTVAPVVIITPVNASGQACSYYVTSYIIPSPAESGFTFNFKDAGTNATPSFNYIVIE